MSQPQTFIIEDDPQLNRIFAITLQNHFAVHSFFDGAEALAALQTASPHLIVLDLNLPGVSGSALLTQIRSMAHLAQTRIILSTADNLQAEMMQDLADVILLKPVSPAQLRDIALRLVKP
jgi:DNA-binding response OmpR family regulator